MLELFAVPAVRVAGQRIDRRLLSLMHVRFARSPGGIVSRCMQMPSEPTVCFARPSK